MEKFDERKKSFEKKFAHDEEKEFIWVLLFVDIHYDRIYETRYICCFQNSRQQYIIWSISANDLYYTDVFQKFTRSEGRRLQMEECLVAQVVAVFMQ